MSELVKFNGASGDLAAAMDSYTPAPPPTGGGPDLLKMLRDGTWVAGKENIEMEDGAELAVNPWSFTEGFVDWGPAKPLQEFSAATGEEPINPANLPPAQGQRGWERQVGFECVVLTGDDEGMELKYKVSTMGGVEAWVPLRNAVKARAVAGKGAVPVITLSNSSYPNTRYGGTTFKPVFEVVRWEGDDVEQIEAPAEEEKPKRKRRA